MYFSCFGKKSTKRSRNKGGASSKCAPLSIPSRFAGTAAIPCSTLLSGCVKAPREILKRAYLARGSVTLAPLKLTSLVTFLFSDKKVTIPPGMDNLHSRGCCFILPWPDLSSVQEYAGAGDKRFHNCRIPSSLRPAPGWRYPPAFPGGIR